MSRFMQVIPVRMKAFQCTKFPRNIWRSMYGNSRALFFTRMQSNSPTQQQEDVLSEPERTMEDISMQMLSKGLFQQIFRKETEVPEEQIAKSTKHLNDHGLLKKSGKKYEDISFQLPKLHGHNIDEHFKILALAQSKVYRNLADELKNMILPQMPTKWVFDPGWTAYSEDGSTAKVDCPTEKALVFDIECLVSEGQYPTLAVAVSPTRWYSWCSERLMRDKISWSKGFAVDDLIPLEPSNVKASKDDSRLVVGHNVSFDRSFVKEQYFLKGTPLRFLDTLSLHMCVSGLTTQQRSHWVRHDNGREPTKEEKKMSRKMTQNNLGWIEVSSPNNLVDVHNLYSQSEQEGKVDKTLRNVFVTGTMSDVRNDFQNLMTYCASDVRATHEVFKSVFPSFLERFPHPVTFAAMLEMGQAYLPVNRNWGRYIEEAEGTYSDLEHEMKQSLMRVASDACSLYFNEQYKKDLWLCDIDWEVNKFMLKKNGNNKEEENNSKKKMKKKKMEKTETREEEEEQEDETEKDRIQRVLDTARFLPKRQQHMVGYPKWYRDLCPKIGAKNWAHGPSLISAQVRIAPKLLKMTWDDYPLYHTPKHGWGYLVPDDRKERNGSNGQRSGGDWVTYDEEEDDHVTYEGVSDVGAFLDYPVDELRKFVKKKQKKEENSSLKGKEVKVDVKVKGCKFYKLPHKDGGGANVGNPLAKDFLSKLEDGTLKAEGGVQAERILEINKLISFWRNAKKRVLSQMVVHIPKKYLPKTVTGSKENDSDSWYGAILPRVITAGTVTRRGVEPTWLTASNALTNRVGSELKAMIQAPPGYHFVGADVDSQELWIASLLGDANFAGFHGCTAFGWMTLQGRKSDGTDMHSMTANTVKISRDHAKIINYARIYGAGQKFAERLLLQFNHNLTSQEAKQKAQDIYFSTKGHRLYHVEEDYLNQLKQIGKSNCDEWVDSSTLKNYSYMLRNRSNWEDSTKEQEDDDDDDDAVEPERKIPVNWTDITDKRRWEGGSESHMFNQLEKIAQSEEPKTPVLDCRISRALEPKNVNNDFLTSRINWVVQSSAVDYLHLILVSMRWLFDAFKIEGRFSISIHDEVRYLVQSEDRYRAALALQITNLLTRCMFAHKVGIHDLPQSVAFFSAVDIDKVLRKEVHMDCVTPSNPHGLERSYGIPQGEALDIYDILQLTNNGNLKKKPPPLSKKDKTVGAVD